MDCQRSMPLTFGLNLASIFRFFIICFWNWVNLRHSLEQIFDGYRPAGSDGVIARNAREDRHGSRSGGSHVAQRIGLRSVKEHLVQASVAPPMTAAAIHQDTDGLHGFLPMMDEDILRFA